MVGDLGINETGLEGLKKPTNKLVWAIDLLADIRLPAHDIRMITTEQQTAEPNCAYPHSKLSLLETGNHKKKKEREREH